MLPYSEAVQRSKKYIQSCLSEELSKHASGEFMATHIGVQMLRLETSRLLAWAETDAGGFDRLRLGIAYFLEKGEELPPDVLKWLVRHLRGDVNRPKAWAGRKNKHWLHMHIYLAVLAREREGMTATRNDASESISACDAVADALAELGQKPKTFDGVKRIWLQYRGRAGADMAVFDTE